MKNKTKFLTTTAVLTSASAVLSFISFSVPFMPSFIKLDIGELPALIGSFAMGPLCGFIICLLKNIIHLMSTTTGGIGELSNFLLGISFVVPAGLIYKRKKTRGTALLGTVCGAVLMSVVSIFTNYFMVYPVYINLFMPEEVILSAYKAIYPGVKNLLHALIVFNAPFTLLKGTLNSIVAFLIYKHISGFLKRL